LKAYIDTNKFSKDKMCGSRNILVTVITDSYNILDILRVFKAL